MGWMWISIILFLGLLCVAGWFATIGAKPGGQEGEELSEEVLKRRYASGEIDDETYKRMLDNLQVPGTRK